MTLPDLAWLNSIPLIGDKLYSGWHNLLDMGGSAIWQSTPLCRHHHHMVCRSGGAYRSLYAALCPDAAV
jgi:hypothetical protein